MADFKSPATKLTTDFPGLTINWSSWYDLLKLKGYSDTAKLCVFRPGVQVLDNWGWCTGMCATDYENFKPVDGKEKNGCYDDFMIDDKSPDKQCDPSKVNVPGIDQWVKYSQVIVVAP